MPLGCRVGMFVVWLVIGLVLLVAGAEFLVRGAGNLALALRIPALVVGLTVVAAGTSAPELTVSLIAAINASTAIAVSNVNGSNIANIALVLGLAALVTPLVVERSLLRRDVPACLGLQALVPIVAFDGMISRVDGGVIIAGGLAYNAWLFYDVFKGREAPPDGELEVRDAPIWQHGLMVVGGLAVLVLGADLFVDGAVGVAKIFELSDRFIGLTVVAVGTSAPEIATALVSARRGDVEMAVGNSLGSNLFNVWMVLGVTAVVRPMDLSGGGFLTDMLIALVVTLLLVPIALRGSLGRIEGGMLVTGYLAYIAWGYLAGT